MNLFVFQVDNAYWMWTFQGRILQKKPIERFCQLLWRPRPQSLLTDVMLKDMKRSMKKYAAKFELKDRMFQSKASKVCTIFFPVFTFSFCQLFGLLCSACPRFLKMIPNQAGLKTLLCLTTIESTQSLHYDPKHLKSYTYMYIPEGLAGVNTNIQMAALL
jgi:hypothetical protein